MGKGRTVLLLTVFLSLALLVLVTGVLSFSSSRGQGQISFHIAYDGRQIVFAANGRGRQDIYTLDLSSYRVARVANTSAYESHPSFSPDGRWIIFSATPTLNEPAHLFVSSPDGTHCRQLTSGESGFDSYPSFSKDGSQIVFARASLHRPYSMGGWVWDDWDLWVINSDGSGIKRLTQAKYRQVSTPRFLADSKQVIYSANSGPKDFQIYTIEVANPDSMKLLTAGYAPCPSPDGKHIVFISDRVKAFDFELWLMKPDGGSQNQITSTEKYKMNPVFTPDGGHILFLSFPKRLNNAGNRYDLLEVDKDGKNLRMIADSTLFDAPMRWKP